MAYNNTRDAYSSRDDYDEYSDYRSRRGNTRYDADDDYADDEIDEQYEEKSKKRNIFSRMFDRILGGKEEDYDDSYDEPQEEEDKYRRSYSSHEKQSSSSKFSSAKSSIHYNRNEGAASAEVSVICPDSFDDAANIVNEVKQGKITIFVFEQTESSIAGHDARRTVDYVCGAAEGMECAFDKLSTGIFCIAPKGVKITKQKPRKRV